MISEEEKKYLILKTAVIIFISLTILSMTRILLFESYNDSLYILFLKEMFFSVLYVLFIFSMLYIMIRGDVQQIIKKAFGYAYTDGLTGLYNRHYLNSFLKKFASLNKEAANFAIVFIDIDKFKEINDTLGHPSGDCILKSLALILKSLTREKDTLCRYGGEEFLIIYSNITKEDTIRKMEHIRKAVESTFFHCKHNHITISIGISFGTRDDDINEIIQEADKALYTAKNAGRNCVKIFDKK